MLCEANASYHPPSPVISMFFLIFGDAPTISLLKLVVLEIQQMSSLQRQMEQQDNNYRILTGIMILSKGWVSFKKLEKHLESADLRQAAHSRVHVQQESFKTFLDPDGNPEHHQNVIICSLSYYQPFLKFSSKSVQNFWSYFANKQTNASSSWRR